MKLGTIVYNNEIYNLDYMTSEEIKEIVSKIETNKQKNLFTGKRFND